MDKTGSDKWFVEEVLPLEAALTRYIRRNWRDPSEVEDIRQEVYVRVYAAAARDIPTFTQAFVFSTARNLLIDRTKRGKIVSMEPLTDADERLLKHDVPGPDRHCLARDELNRLQIAMDALPPRCREIVMMRKIYDMPQREVAQRLGLAEDTVERQVMIGVRRLTTSLFGEEALPKRRLNGVKLAKPISLPPCSLVAEEGNAMLDAFIDPGVETALLLERQGAPVH